MLLIFMGYDKAIPTSSLCTGTIYLLDAIIIAREIFAAIKKIIFDFKWERLYVAL